MLFWRRLRSVLPHILFLLFCTVMVLLFIFALSGCQSSNAFKLFDPSSWLGSGSGSDPIDTPTVGELVTWDLLRWAAMATLMPGLAMLFASVWIGMLRKQAFLFLGMGVVFAVLPWFLAKFGPVLIWPTVIVCSLAGVALVVMMVRKVGMSWTVVKEHKQAKAELTKLQGNGATRQALELKQTQVDNLHNKLRGKRDGTKGKDK